LQLQEIETAIGRVKRYTRPEETAPPAAPRCAVRAGADGAAQLAADPGPAGDFRRKVCCGPPTPQTASANRYGRPNRSTQRARALQRGTLVHRLPAIAARYRRPRRREAALAYLARNADGWTEEERQALAESTLALIADARFAPVFAPGSRAEVSIVGRLERPGGRPALVSGQIDRLVVTANEVLIVDFKTNHAPPSRP
jgi:ATP-dependent helicase/nuclease subunit A